MTDSRHSHPVVKGVAQSRAAGDVGAKLDEHLAWHAAQTPTAPPDPAPVPGATLDTTRDGWGLFSAVYVKGDPGLGLDSAFDATRTPQNIGTPIPLANLSQVSFPEGPNGLLRITAERKAGMTGGRAFASACVGTKNTFSQKYGAWEAEIKLPLGWAAFPAFWGLEVGKVVTPPEDDIMEAYTGGGWDGAGPRSVTHTLWYRDEDDGSTGGAYQHAQPAAGAPDFTQDFHVFRREWSPNLMRYLVDGRETWRVTDASVIPDVAMYPIVNLAVGAPTYRADARTPATLVMDVAYVRVSA